MTAVYQAFSAARNGQNYSDPSELLPYATTPEQIVAVQKVMDRANLWNAEFAQRLR